VTWDPGFGPLIDTRLRIATWNVWGRYGPWEARQPIIEANLRAIDADIICLQEAWEDDVRSQPAELASALGMSYVYERAFIMNGGW
jgi:endonuclease/exonuclease/phosphatase family metal-dependent hydrolase